MNEDEPAGLSAIIGDRLRTAREEAGVRQEDVARTAAEFGLTWGRSSVAMLEAGKRKLSAEEFILLPAICAKSGIKNPALIQDEDKIQVSPEEWIWGSNARIMVEATFNPTKIAKLPNSDTISLSISEDHAADSIENWALTERWDLALRFFYIGTKIWPDLSETLATLPPEIPLNWITSPTQFDRKLSRRIYGDQHADQARMIVLVSFALYGCPAEIERDNRTPPKAPDESKRALQSARGHATRNIIREIWLALRENQSQLHEYSRQILDKTFDETSYRKWVGWLGSQWWEDYEERTSRPEKHKQQKN